MQRVKQSMCVSAHFKSLNGFFDVPFEKYANVKSMLMEVCAASSTKHLCCGEI